MQSTKNTIARLGLIVLYKLYMTTYMLIEISPSP